MTFRVEGISGTILRQGENAIGGTGRLWESPTPNTTGNVLSWIVSMLGGIAVLIGVLAILL